MSQNSALGPFFGPSYEILAGKEDPRWRWEEVYLITCHDDKAHQHDMTSTRSPGGASEMCVGSPRVGHTCKARSVALPQPCIELVLRLLRYRAGIHRLVDGPLHPVWRVGAPIPDKSWQCVWLQVRKSHRHDDAAFYRRLSANGHRCPLYVFDYRHTFVARRWSWLSYSLLFRQGTPHTMAMQSAIPWPGQTKAFLTMMPFDMTVYLRETVYQYCTTAAILCAGGKRSRHIALNEFEVYVTVALCNLTGEYVIIGQQ